MVAMESKQHISTKPRARAWPVWTKAYLSSLADVGTHTAAANGANIDRTTAWLLRKADPAFEAACADAMDQFADSLEAAAVKRGRDGVVTTFVGKDGTIYENRNYSDTLLDKLLRANRPDKYREKVDVLVVIRAEARRMAEERGLDAATLIAEAERIATGQAAP